MEIATDFGFASHWLNKWTELFQAITGQSNAKPKKRELLSTLNRKLLKMGDKL